MNVNKLISMLQVTFALLRTVAIKCRTLQFVLSSQKANTPLKYEKSKLKTFVTLCRETTCIQYCRASFRKTVFFFLFFSFTRLGYSNSL